MGADELTRVLGVDAPRRMLGFIGLARAALASLLLAAALIYRDPPLLSDPHPQVFLTVALLYTVFAWSAFLFLQRRPVLLPRHVVLLLAVDVVVITLLTWASGGVRSGIAALLVVFVGAAGLTLRTREALFAAALAALALLGQQLAGFAAGHSGPEDFVPAGVLGAIIFLLSAAASPLARRLEESEALAHQRGLDLENLAQLNDYIIQNLRESIVVVDERERIRLVNPSAARLLGLRNRLPGQQLSEAAPALHALLARWRSGTAQARLLPRFLAADGSTEIDTHIAPLGSLSEGPVLIFLEDAALMAEKVQQSKLAALGRLSASIAHEIRNPVGAMSHASQLLAETPSLGEEERRFLSIITGNARRVSEIVDSVLQLSRREASRPELIDLGSFALGFATEFAATLELPAGQPRLAGPAQGPAVRMDPGHLRQVLWNLCENALTHGRDPHGRADVEIAWGRLASSGRPFLSVTDRGPGVAAELAGRIFEPFATGRHGGTGLGLFISRELCECNRATLLQEPGAGGGSSFRIVFADPGRWVQS